MRCIPSMPHALRLPTALTAALAACVMAFVHPARAEEPQGYYRQPAIWHDTIVFVAEGDLWTVPVTGGRASRLTSHLGSEGTPAISPDGAKLAFTAQYEGPTEVYTMPMTGGVPARRTFDAARRVGVAGWTPGGHLIYATSALSTLPNTQLVEFDPDAGTRQQLPLWQAAEGAFDAGGTLYFARLGWFGSNTRRYKGGAAQQIWRFAPNDKEATLLTGDYAGTSKSPMLAGGRVYFLSDRDGTMNIWSMKTDGSDVQQHTRFTEWEIRSASSDGQRIVYQRGADLGVYDIASGQSRDLVITLPSDFDQAREQWVKKPMDYLTAAHLSPTGDRVVLTARGRLFVAPRKSGRFVEASRLTGVRYRNAHFSSDGKSLVTLSDQSGEVELWTVPANGVGAAQQLTRDAAVLRWDVLPSPDGGLIAHHDKNLRLWVYNTATKTNARVDSSNIDNFGEYAWSPDGKWLAYVAPAENMFRRIVLWNSATGARTFATSDHFDSYAPAWSTDGQWLYFLSDRTLKSMVDGVWGPYQPEPYLDKRTKIYALPLKPGLRSPFAPADELHSGDAAAPAAPVAKGGKTKAGAAEAKAAVVVAIDTTGLRTRLQEVSPVPAGNYSGLFANAKALFWRSADTGESKTALKAIAFGNEKPTVKTVADEVTQAELSQDGSSILVRQDDALFVIDAAAAPAEDLAKSQVSLDAWMLSIAPREEWRQMYTEAWRLERDYFYDRGMQGVDWPRIRARYQPLAERVASRADLSDVLQQMIAELSALHMYVYGGDIRQPQDDVKPGSLGALLVRDLARGGERVARIYRDDPDLPGAQSPLARPGVEVREGDIITAINGVPVLTVPDAGVVLRGQAGRQVLLHIAPASGPERDVIVTPMAPADAANLRYADWEYTARLRTEEWSKDQIGYLHLRSMGTEAWTNFARDFYPAFTKQGLIIDARNNTGGNIESWVLEKLIRKAWSRWNQRVGLPPNWNMQYAFRGHLAVLVNQQTVSDGELFCAGIQQLKLGPVIGARSLGGEIWLSSDNFLADGGIATAAEYGVFGPDNEWMVEGVGVQPDIVVDNLPHATFSGEDAQLRAAVDYLQKKIAAEPIPAFAPPPFPNKAFDNGPVKK